MDELSRHARRGLRWLLKPANPLAPILTAAKDVRNGGEALNRVAVEGLFDRETEVDARIGSVADPQARFRLAMTVHEVTEEDLPALERAARQRLNMSSIAVLVLFVWAVVSGPLGMQGNSGFRWLDRLMPLLVLPPVVALAIRASIRLHQIRCRALVPFRHWLGQPHAWVGEGTLRGIAVLLLAASIWAGGVSHAYAAEQGPPEVTVPSTLPTVPGALSASAAQSLGLVSHLFLEALKDHDLSLEWTRRMFPGLGFLWGEADQPDVIASLFLAFNTILMAVATIWMTWHIITGTVSTAYEGKLLGERYHQWWAPLRVILGIGLLAPVKGYCLAQILAVQLFLAGFSVANGIWALYVTTMLSPTSSAVVVPPRLNGGSNLAAQVLRLETCAHVMIEEGANRSTATGVQGSWWDRVRAAWFEDERPTVQVPPVMGVKVDGGRLWDYGRICGSLRVPETDPDEGFTALFHDAADDAERRAKIAAYRAFDVARSALLTTFLQRVRETGLARDAAATAVVVPTAADAAAAIDKVREIKEAAAQYNSGVTQAAKVLAAALDVEGRLRFANTSIELGWASAGSLNFTLFRLSAEAASRAAGAYPEVVDVDASKLSGDLQRPLNFALGALAVVIRDTSMSDVLERADVQVREDLSSANPLIVVAKVPFDMLAKGLADAAALDAVHPISSIQALGNASLVAGEAMLVGWIGLNVAARGVEKAAENGVTNVFSAPGAMAVKALETAAVFVDVVIGALILFGAVSAYVLPMIPFILWYVAVMGCATYMAVVVVAAPIAALLHIKMDGQELIDEPQKLFYKIAFTAMLRPTLLLFGLILANVVFAVMAGFLNKMVSVAMLSSMGDSIIGIVGILSMMAILLYLHYQLCTQAYSLIIQVPAHVSQYLGVQDAARNEENDTNVAVGGVVNMSRTASATVASRALMPTKAGDGNGAPEASEDGGQPSATGNVSKVKSARPSGRRDGGA